MFALALVRLYYSALLLRQTEEMVATRAQGAKEALRRPKEELGSKRLRSPEPAIILVMSSRTDRSRRDAIRETWANGRRDVKFLVGRYGCDIPPTNRAPHACEVLTVATDSEARNWNTVTARVDTELDKEMQQHNDTLLLEMVDEYRTLPLKLKLGYAWAVKNTDVSWIIKTDDDVYLRPAAMQAWFGGPDLQLAPENRTTTNPLKALSVSHNIDPERMRACYQHEIKGSGLLIKNT